MKSLRGGYSRGLRVRASLKVALDFRPALQLRIFPGPSSSGLFGWEAYASGYVLTKG